MKVIYSLFIAVLTFGAFAQCDTSRYADEMFTSVFKHQDVKYGEGQVWTIPYGNTDLFMDIYEPIGDVQLKRPLMFWVHPGGFLNGDKSADDMVALCDSFARRGYVTVSLGYRLGFNPLSSTSAERAVYRGVQDLRAAIRFMKEYADVYQVDTNYTFVGGSSAGGFSTLHLAYMDDDEAPTSIQGGWTYPGLGCLDCSGNTYSHNMDLTGIVNLWGAIGDSTWIDVDETVPALLMHGTGDGTVPYDVGHPFGVFTTPITHGSRSVSNQLTAQGIPHRYLEYDGLSHEFHGADNGTFNNPPNEYWDTIFMEVRKHYFDLLRPDTSPITNTPSACEGDIVTFYSNQILDEVSCWNQNIGTVLNDYGDSIEIMVTNTGANNIDLRKYNEINAASELTTTSLTVFPLPLSDFNFVLIGDSIETMDLSVDAVGYEWDFGDGETSTDVNPTHTYLTNGDYTLTLTVTSVNGCTQTSSQTVQVQGVSLEEELLENVKVYPNPTASILNIVNIPENINVTLVDMLGRTIVEVPTNSASTQIDVKGIQKGIYLVQFSQNGDRIAAKRFVIE